jgi:RecA/RadA recombinase
MAAKDLYAQIIKNKVVSDCIEEVGKGEVVDFINTGVLPINLLLSGRVDGGVPIGRITITSMPSMYGKSILGLSVIKNAQKKGMFCVFIDTEKAFSEKTAEGMGINLDKTKFMQFKENSIEEVRKFIMNVVDGVEKKDRKNILFVLDSLGSLITSKTIEDSLEGSDTVDLTETKKKNQLANIMLYTGATFFVINHVYLTLDKFNPLAIPGGTKMIHNSDCVLLGKTRAKEKSSQDGDITGHLINVMSFKSRHAIEKKELKFRINHSGGISALYGILDDALTFGVVTQPTKGFYTRQCVKDDKKWREKEIYTTEFWLPIFHNTKFKQQLEDVYKLQNKFELNDPIVEEGIDEIIKTKGDEKVKEKIEETKVAKKVK